MAATNDKQAALELEQAAFDSQLPELLQEHSLEFVVFRDRKPVGFFKTYDEAYNHALDTFGLDTVFLIAQVVEQDRMPASISWYAGVMFG